jgi:hypothetical protein
MTKLYIWIISTHNDNNYVRVMFDHGSDNKYLKNINIENDKITDIGISTGEWIVLWGGCSTPWSNIIAYFKWL